MKVCVLQPHYSVCYEESDACFSEEIKLLDQCDDSMDVIVCPEMCDVPALCVTKERFEASANRYHAAMMQKAIETAKRCNAVLFINGCDFCADGIRNTTFVFDRKGCLVGKYYKQHLTPGEVDKRKLDSAYSFAFEEPVMIEVEGVRYGFLTCYDFYFYEAFSNFARYRPDVIIGCSHQRSDSHEALELMTRFLAYNTNAYVFRSSVSMEEHSGIGGASMIVAPDGTVLEHLRSRVGMAVADIDVSKKFYKPAGFGNPDTAHWEYIERGRRPWKYRPAGSAIVCHDARMDFPRVCARKEAVGGIPSDSMPYFGTVIAMGAEEIELNLWQTKDGAPVCASDSAVKKHLGDQATSERSYGELSEYDWGVDCDPSYHGLSIPTLEDVLQKFSCHAVMNLHLKTCADEAYLKEILRLIHKYDCEKHVYFTAEDGDTLALLQKDASSLRRCCSAKTPIKALASASVWNCSRVAFEAIGADSQVLKTVHERGLRCNVICHSREEAEKWLELGADTVITDVCPRILQIKETIKKEKKYV